MGTASRRTYWTVFFWDPAQQDIRVAHPYTGSEGLAYGAVRREFGPSVVIGPIYRSCLGQGIRLDRAQSDDRTAGAVA